MGETEGFKEHVGADGTFGFEGVGVRGRSTKWLRWMGRVLRREDEDLIKMAWELDGSVARGRGGLKMTWKDEVKREARKCGLREEDTQDWVKWRRMTWMNGNSNSLRD